MNRSRNVDAMLSPLPVPACLFDETRGQIIGVNERFAKLLGYSESALLSISWRELFPRDELPAAERAVERAAAGDVPGVPVQFRVRRQDGRVISVVFMSRRINLVHDDGSMQEARMVLVVGTDEQRPRPAEEVYGP